MATDSGRWPITYYVHSRPLWQDDGPAPPLTIGTGIIWWYGLRFRVEDIWVSYDNVGVFDGVSVFLTSVSGKEGDLPGQLEPSHFPSS